MYTIIIEQTKEFAKRVKYDPITNSFSETEFDSLFHRRGCPYPYGWIKESGTPPNKHLDVILVSDAHYDLGESSTIKIIGVFKRNDGDHKLVGVLKDNPIEDLFELEKNELTNLTKLYPELSEHEGWHGKDQADRVIKEYFKF